MTDWLNNFQDTIIGSRLWSIFPERTCWMYSDIFLYSSDLLWIIIAYKGYKHNTLDDKLNAILGTNRYLDNAIYFIKYK